MAADDMVKTVMITPFDLYDILRMPFEFRNAAQSFHKFIDDDFSGFKFMKVHKGNFISSIWTWSSNDCRSTALM